MLPCGLVQDSRRESVCGVSPKVRPIWELFLHPVMFPFISLLSFGSWKQHRDVSSSAESAVSMNSLYARTTAPSYIEGESPHLPRELDHSLGIAREEVPPLCFFSWF